MGGNNTKVEYGVYIGEEKKGETRVLRHPYIKDGQLSIEPEPGINTIWKAFTFGAKNSPNKGCLGTRKFISKDKYGDYEWKTYKEVETLARQFASGIVALDFCPEVKSEHDGVFKFLGIYSKNREEWVIADLGAHATGATVVTFYDTLGESTIEYILEQTKLTTMVIESKSLKKLTTLKKEGKSGELKNIVVMDVEDEGVIKQAEEAGLKIYKFPDVLTVGKEKTCELKDGGPETIATFCYTSGTTGVPKGAMISHRGILADITSLTYHDIIIDESDSYLSYLPLAHIMERVVITAQLLRGCSVGFFTGNAAKLMDDAQLLKPTLFVGVPRIYQRIYEVITTGMSKLGTIKKMMADRAVSSKLDAYRKNGALTSSIWDRLVFNKSKSALGGRVRLMLTGSAPIAGDMLEFLKICFCCPIIEGYGQTESCAAALITRANDQYIGHTGGISSAAELKLVDCESLNYKSTDVNEKGEPEPRGEICIRGNILFSGYFNDPENTKKTVDSDGWMHTGDVGAIIKERGYATKIIDRVKNIFKLSQGEYVAPEKLENILIKSKYVQQIFVHGESLESYLIAVVVPKKEPCVEFLHSKGIETTKDQVHEHFGNKELKEDIVKDMEKLGKSCDFKGFEVIKRVHLSNEPFSVDNNLLTPTMKLKRNEVKQAYLKELKGLYADK